MSPCPYLCAIVHDYYVNDEGVVKMVFLDDYEVLIHVKMVVLKTPSDSGSFSSSFFFVAASKFIACFEEILLLLK